MRRPVVAAAGANDLDCSHSAAPSAGAVTTGDLHLHHGPHDGQTRLMLLALMILVQA